MKISRITSIFKTVADIYTIRQKNDNKKTLLKIIFTVS